MADEFYRSKLYEYGANSNLVLEADRDSNKRRDDEGKGEVETLNGKLVNVRMGDKLAGQSSKPSDLTDRIEKAKLKRQRDEVSTEIEQKKSGTSKKVFFSSGKGNSILSQTDDLDSLNYRPKTRESRSAYEELLRFTQMLIGDQPHDILKGAADEILATLKDESMRDTAKQREVEKVTNKINADSFYKMVTLGKRITDYHVKEDDAEMDPEQAARDAEEEMEMAVVFEDDEEEGEADMEQAEEVDEKDEEDEEDYREDAVEATGRGQVLTGKDDDEEDEAARAAADRYHLAIHDIDAHWLQRQLSKYYSDANISAKLADDVLATLSVSDERQCENKLVVLLDYDKFELIKMLLKNREKIYYCTRLKQAQTEQEVEHIEKEMQTEGSGRGAVLLQLIRQKASAESWTQDRIGEFASKARREARELNKKGGAKDSLKINDDDQQEAFFVSTGGGGAEGSKLLSLEDLTFNEGGRLMTNKRCELPDKSWRAQKKGYEEVHVPALRPKMNPGETLVDVTDLPAWMQPAFQGVRALNRVQSKMMPAALERGDNLLLCAPTGAGKTNVALMCMLQELGKHRREDGTFDLSAFKIVYVAPMKALVQEVVQSFTKRLEPFGVQVRELSGDQNLTRQQIQATQVVVTTPEKWDIITRKAGDRTYTQLVRLMIIDEIHLLHDDRGPVLEALIARTIRQIESTQEMVRLVGLSATLPNYEDVATFLRVEPDKGMFFFDNSYRPVPLQQQYIGITEKKALKRFQLMNEICYEKVLQQAGKNQVLIFVHSRAETAKTAHALKELAEQNDTLNRFVREDSASMEVLRTESETAKNGDLKALLPYGFAIHHAGMVRGDRSLVEDLFADKHVQVLVSTATLAWGVNLPCHTVILKGTQMYNPEQGRWVELSPLDIMQMMGRAGRYGLDSEGEGIIMTAHSELQYYLSLMNQQLPIESQFVKRLPDMLNAEVVMGSISSVKEAAAWLGYTYMYVRMLRNPVQYGISIEEAAMEPSLLQRRIDLVHTAATLLDKHDLLKYDRKSGAFQSTVLGRVSSHYYVSHETMNVFNEHLKPHMSEIEVFRLFSLSGEFQQIHVREEEKLELAKLIGRVPIPVKEGVDEPSAKVNVLLQAYISRLKLEGFALAADMAYIQQSACRLMRALFEIALKRGWAGLTSKILSICKMVERRTWGSQSPLRQFTGIPEVIIRKLEKNSDIGWERYFDLKPQDLGEMVKIPKMGKTLYKFVHMFPRLLVNAHVLPLTRSLLQMDITLTPDYEVDAQVHEGANQLFWIIVEDVDGDKVLHHEPFTLRSTRRGNGGASTPEEYNVTFTVPLMDPSPPQYYIRVLSDRWMHSETLLPVSFRHLILPQRFPPPTELLDLQPLPVAALSGTTSSGTSIQALFKGFKQPFFNPLQTQTFSTLYESDESCLICAPTGSGKTVCAEFAILRLFAQQPDAKCVYVGPRKEVVEEVYNSWSQRLEPVLGKAVVMLTGEITTDLNLLAQGSIVCASATHWDILSRRWKQRKAVQQVSLYIMDELHLLGGTYGPTMEIVASRARFVASQVEKTVRIVGLSFSLANAKDVGEWIGASSHSIYNFTPDVRPVPLDIHLQSFEVNHFASRLLAMAKPTYNAIIKHAAATSTVSGTVGQKPSLVFVPSRKQAQLTAIDILSFAAANNTLNRFNPPESVATAILAAIRDPAVGQLCSQGVGFMHNGLHSSDKRKVEALFAEGRVKVLVVPHNMCWSVSVPASLVVVLDTVYYEGREHRHVDYSITDILQMIGKASRQGIDQSATCVLLCHAPKREYLKRLLHDPLPIESHLDHYLHDHMNAEVVTKTVENKPDAVDYLTWSFFYRRLVQNPNYYNLQGVSHRHVSDHLSELVESTLTDLEESKCLAVEDDIDLEALNLGMIASYYYIQYTTMELFSSSLTNKTKIKGVLEILSSASEFGQMTIREGEDKSLMKLARHLPNPLPGMGSQEIEVNPGMLEDCATKTLILLQAHFSRAKLGSELVADQTEVLLDALKLLQSMVDVISSQGWLKPALAAMEASQMVVQGQWDKDSLLLQVPHFTQELVETLKQEKKPVETVFDILDLEDEDRTRLLAFPAEQLSDIALFCNAYPNIELEFEVEGETPEGAEEEEGVVHREFTAGQSVSMRVQLSRELDEDEEEDPEYINGLGKVVAARYPNKEKREGWWLVLGDPSNNSLLSIKRIALVKDTKVKLDFTVPETAGDYSLVLYLMCDSYLGCDQEYSIQVTALPNDEEMDEGEEEE